MKKICISLLLITITAVVTLYGQSVNQMAAHPPQIVPQPINEQLRSGYLIIAPGTRITHDDNTAASAAFFNNYLASYYHFQLKMGGKEKNAGAKSQIAFVLDKDYADTTIGAYTLSSAGNQVVITSHNPEGIFYGIQTLIQLLPVDPVQKNQLIIPHIKIKDGPRFGYRGMMLDVGRHFMPVAFVKKFIDYMALHKMNTFHWHLTEDQGWRIEIKKYPRLTEVGAWRNGTILGHYPDSKENDGIRTGGYYTQQEIKEVVRYAADRYITIIPEIELPGHSSAAIAAYPQLSCFPDSATEQKLKWSESKKGKQVQQTWGVFKDVYAPTPYTFHFIEDVLDEVMALFPSRYIHIGGDECPKSYWKESPYCQQLIKEKGLKNEEGLQSYFIGQVGKYLNSKGREIIGWDEILEGGLTPGATVQSWHGESGGIQAAKMKHKVIMSPYGTLYLTRSQKDKEDSLIVGGKLPLRKIYHYDPRANIDSSYQDYVLGAEACIWTEYMKTPAKVEYMIFPRLAAVSEVFWSQPENKDYAGFVERLKSQVERYKLWKVNYSRVYSVD